jgi:D-alanyl-lipoteichoic acid acyltransferase DltB (MBOAT superfamily)
MTFVELDYLFVFLPLTVILYLIFRKTVVTAFGKTAIANVVILAASYYFYGAAVPWYLIPLVVTSLIDFAVGIQLSKTDRQPLRKLLLVVSLAANLGLLAFFKYTPWLIGSFNDGLRWLGTGVVLPTLAVTLPPGISFYTFQTMSYTIEVYRREMAPARNIIDYMAFVTFWPHLVAGPIMRARNLLRQLETIRPVVSLDETRYALVLIAWGLFKKMALADNFGHIVESIDNVVHANVAAPGVGVIFAYAFAGQIYCDFSAYTDIARGSAKLVGVELVRNFHTPYFAASPGEFWRRWHISLSTWLRDYLYIPLGGNRYGRLVEYRSLMITMLLGGLWHGAGVLFILWGFWHGLMLVLYRMVPIDRHLTDRLGAIGKWLAILITFHLVCFGWILFRAHTDTFMPLMHSIGGLIRPNADLTLFKLYGRGVIFLGAVILATDYLGYRKNVEFPELLKNINPYLAAVFAVVCYFGITILARREGAQFIYFQF